MWHILGTSEGTLYYNNFANLVDQELVNKNMAEQTSPIQAVSETLEIVRFPGMVNTESFPAPIPFGGMGKPVNTNGYSDHFPIAMTVREAD
jgi:hypothetical protein